IFFWKFVSFCYKIKQGCTNMVFFAHTKSDCPKEEWQLLKDHLHNTALMSKQFADTFDTSEIAFVIGLLHDIGKYSEEFQQLLQGRNIHVDHSTAGAKEATKLYGKSIGRL